MSFTLWPMQFLAIFSKCWTYLTTPSLVNWGTSLTCVVRSNSLRRVSSESCIFQFQLPGPEPDPEHFLPFWLSRGIFFPLIRPQSWQLLLFLNQSNLHFHSNLICLYSLLIKYSVIDFTIWASHIARLTAMLISVPIANTSSLNLSDLSRVGEWMISDINAILKLFVGFLFFRRIPDVSHQF